MFVRLGLSVGQKVRPNNTIGSHTDLFKKVWLPIEIARRGFEPLISSVRGRHPRPLDERAITEKHGT